MLNVTVLGENCRRHWFAPEHCNSSRRSDEYSKQLWEGNLFGIRQLAGAIRFVGRCRISGTTRH
jgi:hypothetical protein